VTSDISDLIRALIAQVGNQVEKLDSELSDLRGLVEKHRHFNQQQRGVLEAKVTDNQLAIQRLSGSVSALSEAMARADDIEKAKVDLEGKRIDAEVRKSETNAELRSKIGLAVIGLLSGLISALATMFVTNGASKEVDTTPPAQVEQEHTPALPPGEDNE
jgi:TolA-binding protein